MSGVEIDEKLVSLAKANLNLFNNSTLIETFNGLDFPNSIRDFDFITLNDVFHHIPACKRSLFLDNLFKSMKPGSFLIFKDINLSLFAFQ